MLFQGASWLEETALAAIAAAPDPVVPIDAVAAAIEAIAAAMQDGRAHARQRAAVVDANTALMERELLKMAAMATAVSGALQARGVPASTADLAAQSGSTVFRVSFERWISDSAVEDYPELVRESFRQLKAVAAGG